MKRGIILLALGLLIVTFGVVIRISGSSENLYTVGLLTLLFGSGMTVAGVATMILTRLG